MRYVLAFVVIALSVFLHPILSEAGTCYIHDDTTNAEFVDVVESSLSVQNGDCVIEIDKVEMKDLYTGFEPYFGEDKWDKFPGLEAGWWWDIKRLKFDITKDKVITLSKPLHIGGFYAIEIINETNHKVTINFSDKFTSGIQQPKAAFIMDAPTFLLYGINFEGEEDKAYDAVVEEDFGGGGILLKNVSTTKMNDIVIGDTIGLYNVKAVKSTGAVVHVLPKDFYGSAGNVVVRNSEFIENYIAILVKTKELSKLKTYISENKMVKNVCSACVEIPKEYVIAGIRYAEESGVLMKDFPLTVEDLKVTSKGKYDKVEGTIHDETGDKTGEYRVELFLAGNTTGQGKYLIKSEKIKKKGIGNEIPFFTYVDVNVISKAQNAVEFVSDSIVATVYNNRLTSPFSLKAKLPFPGPRGKILTSPLMLPAYDERRE